MKTFVHHDGALGDVLLSLPCLRTLRAPGSTLHFAGRPDIGRLLRDSGIVEEASDAGKRLYSQLYAGLAGGELRSFLGGFDRAAVFTVNAENPVVSAVAAVIGETRVVTTVPPQGVRIGAARFRLAQLDPESLPDKGTRLPVPALHRELAEAMLSRWGWKGDRPLVMVHPGSGGRNKCWPLDRFFGMISDLHREDAFIVLFTGPAEDDLFLDRVEEFCRERERTIHVGDADLSALAALLGRCGAYVGNDSGVSHLAAAVGAPTVALFGPTDPVVWGPIGERVTVIAADSIDAVPVEKVTDAVRVLLAGEMPGTPPSERP